MKKVLISALSLFILAGCNTTTNLNQNLQTNQNVQAQANQNGLFKKVSYSLQRFKLAGKTYMGIQANFKNTFGKDQSEIEFTLDQSKTISGPLLVTNKNEVVLLERKKPIPIMQNGSSINNFPVKKLDLDQEFQTGKAFVYLVGKKVQPTKANNWNVIELNPQYISKVSLVNSEKRPDANYDIVTKKALLISENSKGFNITKNQLRED